MRKTIALALFFIVFQAFAYGQNAEQPNQISTSIKGLLSTEGKIIYGNEPNSVMIIDYPENLQRVADALDTIDSPPQQVLIEARVVEVRLDEENAMGINWTLFGEKGSAKAGQFRVNSDGAGGAGLIQAIPLKTVWESAKDVGSTPLDPFTMTIFDENINVVLQAVANTLNTDILSAPRIATVNNHPADIKIIQSFPWAEPQVDTSDSGATTVTWQTHFEEIGIMLRVTPTINDDGKIALNIMPEISEFVENIQLEVQYGLGQSVTYDIPKIDKRTASTRVVVGNGQTLIIGGLIKDRWERQDWKVPFAGDIPILGNLFKTKYNYKEKVELLLMVSPIIIDNTEIVKMQKEYKYGVNRNYIREEEIKAKKRLYNESKESKRKQKLSKDLQQLTEQQKTLIKETKELETAISKEEKNLAELKNTKESLVQK